MCAETETPWTPRRRGRIFAAMATAYAYLLESPPAPAIADYRRARFSADEFLRMEELGAFAGHKVELVDGELLEESLPGWTDGRLQALIIRLLGSVTDDSLVLVGELPVKVSDWTVRDFDVGMTVPDVGSVRAVDPAPVVLAVEIAVTTLSGDLNVKSREYARAGIATYWVVDVAAELVHAMHTPGPDGYAGHARVSFDQPLAVPGGGEIVIAG